MKRAVAVLPLLLVLIACGGDVEPGDSTTGPEPTTASPQPTATQPTQTAEPVSRPQVIGTVARNLEVPWGIAFLPDGSALVTERDSGRVLIVQRGQESQEAGRVDEVSPQGEAGLLGVAISPGFAENDRVFLYATTADDNRVLRGELRDGRLTNLEPILTGIPNGFIHDGGRLAFDEEGLLFVSTGEIGQGELAQDRESLGGKVLRITEDGEPAPGNPFDSPVFSYGHRNIQGLALDDGGNLWASEFGANTWDELNLVERGVNYGWPEVEGKGRRDGFRNPQVVWRTDEASPSGLAFADGHLWMASLRGERLWRMRVEGGKATEPTDFLVGRYGRLRTVVLAPDGNLWVTTSNHDGRGDPAEADDRILLVRP